MDGKMKIAKVPYHNGYKGAIETIYSFCNTENCTSTLAMSLVFTWLVLVLSMERGMRHLGKAYYMESPHT